MGANRPQAAVYGYGVYESRGIDIANLLMGRIVMWCTSVPKRSCIGRVKIPPVNHGERGSRGGFWSATLCDANGFLANNVHMAPNAS